MIKNIVLIATFASFSALANHSAGKAIVYKDKDTEMEGYIVEGHSKKKQMPGILIVHDWMGISDDNRKEAEELAAKGAVAMAVDIYGKTVRPKNPEEAGKTVGQFKDNRAMVKSRIKAAYDVLVQNKNVDPKKILVYGYCFGGMTALELGRSGAELAGIVSFHGTLSSKDPKEASNIKARVLVLHGAIDPLVPNTEVEGFQKEMDAAKKDYEIMKFSGAVHAFTNKKAGGDPSKGVAYNAVAEQRARKQFDLFLTEVLGM